MVLSSTGICTVRDDDEIDTRKVKGYLYGLPIGRGYLLQLHVSRPTNFPYYAARVVTITPLKFSAFMAYFSPPKSIQQSPCCTRKHSVISP